MSRLATAAALALSLAAGPLASCAAETAPAEFTQGEPAGWINSEPLTLGALRGQVVLIEFWTYGCHNCVRTLPWLKAMHARYAGRGLVVVGVHSPEFAHERDPQRVRDAVVRLGIGYPVMLDTDHAYWRALRNRYWPAFYLVGQDGRIAATAIGELHEGTARGDKFERDIVRLLGR